MAIEIGKIRNVGVVGHGGVGKTSLIEALLFTAGAVTRLGKVDDGSGVQVQTEKVWKFAIEYGLPRAVGVNRLDRERADFYRTVESLARRLKGRVVAVQIPLGEESGFRGYVDLVKLR